MAEITQRTFIGDGTTNLLRLYKEEFVRQLNPIPPWTTTRVRVGFLMAIDSGGVNINPSASFFGMCAGADKPFTDANTVHAIGFQLTNLTYVANAGNPYFTPTAYNGVRRVNGVSNTFSGSWPNPYIMSVGGNIRRGMMVLEIEPGLLNCIQCLVPLVANVALDNTLSDLVQVMECSYAQNNSYGTGLALTNAGSNCAGSSAVPLDCINVYWGNGLAPLEIYAICVYRYNS